MTDPYVYPGTTVLINRFEIRDAKQLADYERRLTAQRLREPPPAVPISYEGYKTLHHHLFQDLYDWAGQPRTVALAKGGTFFGPPIYIDREMARRFEKINAESDLRGLSAKAFTERSGEHLCEINAIHPFREGNGRTQRLFLKILSQQAGHELDLARFKKEPWMAASIAGFHGDYAPMVQLIALTVK